MKPAKKKLVLSGIKLFSPSGNNRIRPGSVEDIPDADLNSPG